MSNIISSHNRSIDMGFKGVAEEFSDLQAKVSTLEKERTVLLETIDNLNGEIRQMGANLSSAESEVHKEDSFEADISDIKQECVESLRVQSETDFEEKCVDYEDILDKSVDKQNKSTSDDQNQLLNTYTLSELGEDDNTQNVQIEPCIVKDQDVESDLEQRVSKESPTKYTVSSKEFICTVCKFVLSTSENLVIHMENIHTKLEKSKERQDAKESVEQSSLVSNDTVVSKDAKMSLLHKLQSNIISTNGKKINCDKCPLSCTCKDSLNRHIRVKHDKIRNNARTHACAECVYAAPNKNMLKRHWDAIHNKGDKKYKCKNCPYSSAEKTKLKYHMISVHNMEGKKFKCKECPYSSARKCTLREHTEQVHEKKRSHFCGECGYAAYKSDTLKKHIESRHKINDRC